MTRIAVVALLAVGQSACGEAAPRVTDAGPCLIVIVRTVCMPAEATPICVPEAFMAVRRTPKCLPAGMERGA